MKTKIIALTFFTLLTFSIGARVILSGDHEQDGHELTYYTFLTAEEKREFIWEKIEETNYLENDNKELPSDISAKDIIVKLLNLNPFKNYFEPTFKHTSDFMLKGRKKLFHPYGSVAKVKLEINDEISFLGQKIPTPFTGLLKTGALGVIRLGEAMPREVSGININKMVSFGPGLALKLFIDGIYSQNVVATYDFDGQGKDYNFFKNSLSNKIKPPTIKSVHLAPVIKSIVKGYKKIAPKSDPFFLPIKHLCRKGKQGGRSISLKKQKCPDFLEFIPTEEATALIRSNDKRDSRIKFHKMPLITLYTVKAHWKLGIIPVSSIIGKLNMESPFISSSFGDEKLFFKHVPGK